MGLKGSVVLHAVGFLFQVSMLLEKSVISWIVLHLVLALVLKCNANAVTWKHEVCGLLVVMNDPSFLIQLDPFYK